MRNVLLLTATVTPPSGVPSLQRTNPTQRLRTGRYKIKNIVDLVRSRPPEADIYCHFRDFPHALCELFLLSFTHHGFRSVIEGSYRRLRNDVVPGVHSNEEIAFRRLADRSLPM